MQVLAQVKNIEEHIVRVMKQYRKAMKFAQLKKIDEGTVNRRQAVTTMKFVAQFNNWRTHSKSIMQQHRHAIFKLKKIKDGDKTRTYLSLSLLGVFPARFCSFVLQTKTMETQNRNEILS